MNVLLTKKFMPSDIDYLNKGLSDEIVLVEPREYTEAGVLEKINEATALLGGMVTGSILGASRHIKLFQIPWTGVDNIDFTLLKKHKINCVCNSHSNGVVVAEHALALYFSVAKKVPYHDAQLRRGNWNRTSPEGNEVSPFSCSLTGKKTVLIGYGAVNRAVHRFLSGFKPVTSIVNRSGSVVDAVDSVSVYSFDKLIPALHDADVVFVALPLTSDTNGIINQECFHALSKRAILINVARGSVVDEQALFSALANNRIYGAGIDTWYNYPSPGEGTNTRTSVNFPFHELHNLVMSPHRAGYVDSGFPHLDDAIKNLNNLLAGNPLINQLSVEHRY